MTIVFDVGNTETVIGLFDAGTLLDHWRIASAERTVDEAGLLVRALLRESGFDLDALRDAGVNLVAFHAFPAGRRAQLDFVPEDPRALKAAARKAKLQLSPRKTAFLIEGDDRPGAVADLLDKLAAAGVNVTAMDAIRVDGRYGALLWVAPADQRKAARALGAE